MPEILLRTKLFVPPVRPNLVPRPQLLERLNQGLHLGHKLTLISAPAGFGKTTLVSEWVTGLERPAAWLSLDEDDNDIGRFLAYLVAALQTLVLGRVEGLVLSGVEGNVPNIGEGISAVLQSPQPPPTKSIVTLLLNDITALQDNFLLVLDDYHLVDDPEVNDALTYLLEHQPPQMHLVIATRVDPQLSLSRLRARSQLSELRAADLRFSLVEAAEFLNQTMGLDFSTEDVAALEARTEGWIAGLQLAAISMRGRDDATTLIKSFTGSHRLVLDYLIEEVLDQQPPNVQNFLLKTAVLSRLCGPLCDAVTGQESGQVILEMLDRANLFLIPLDDERRWYRYHHLFADLLRQRLQQISTSSTEDEWKDVAELHIRASEWYEENDLEIEAFQHAAAANDVERAERLVEGNGLPLTFRGVVTPVLHWFESLPVPAMDARPSLWVTYAMALVTTAKFAGVEEKLQAAEAALEGIELNDDTRDLIGRIADTRGTMAVGLRQEETLITQSRRALEYLRPDNVTYRTSATWKLGVAYEWQGDRVAAGKAYAEAVAISEASGNTYTNVLATVGLGDIQLAQNQLYLAADTFQRTVQRVGDLPIPVHTHVYHCLARIFYEWNDLDAAQEYGQKSLQHARPFKEFSYIFVERQVFLARLKLAKGDVTGAVSMLAEADQSMHRPDFAHFTPEVAAVQVLTLLRQNALADAADLAQEYELPMSQARVSLAQGDPSAALALLEPLSREAQAKGWEDEQLKVLVLQAVTHHAHGEKEKAVQLISDALMIGEAGGFMRTFVDEGLPMARLLYEALSQGIAPEYVRRLLAAFPTAEPQQAKPQQMPALESEWFEQLSERELDVLQLIAEGLTNQEVASRLFLSLNTVKAHTRSIYSKLGVNSRTQAVARARALGILTSI